MKNAVLCFSMFITGHLWAADWQIPQIVDCFDSRHPSGLNLRKIEERSQAMFADSNDLSVKVITYLNLKKKIARTVNSSGIFLENSGKLLVSNLMSSASSLKLDICNGFGITESQFILIDAITPLDDAPSLIDCLDNSSPCGLNLAVVAERERILRPHGIADDPATFIVLYRQMKLEMARNEDESWKAALAQLFEKIADSGLGLDHEQISAIM